MSRFNIINRLKTDLNFLKKELVHDEEHLNFTRKAKDTKKIREAEDRILARKTIVLYINSLLDEVYSNTYYTKQKDKE